MKYNISTSTPPKMPRLGKGTGCVKILLSQVSKDMFDPLIPMFFPYFAQKKAEQNFNIPTSFGRNCVGKWQISSQKVGVTRANCHF